MGRPKRLVMAAAAETTNPPDELTESQTIARVERGTGNNIYAVELPSGRRLLVELPSRFRSTIWMRRGGYVLIDMKGLADRQNKLDGEITNVVMNEKAWRKMDYWPKEFVKRDAYEASTEDVEDIDEESPSQELDEDL